MKVSKLLVAGALIATVGGTSLFADYNKGYKYYDKIIKRKTHIKAPQFIKILGVQTPDELEELFANNGKGLIEKLNATGHKKAAKAVEKIIKKHKLNDLKDFLIGIMNGKIPAGCGWYHFLFFYKPLHKLQQNNLRS